MQPGFGLNLAANCQVPAMLFWGNHLGIKKLELHYFSIAAVCYDEHPFSVKRA